MFKLQTTFKNFRFNTIQNKGPYTVTWYKLHEYNFITEGICLNQQELNELTNYVANNKINFDNQNYFSCIQDDTPACDINGIIPSRDRQPTIIILRNVPQLSKQPGIIYNCMDIELLNNNGTLNQSYNLNFDIIGKIEL